MGLAKHQLNTPSKAISIDVFPDPLQMTQSRAIQMTQNFHILTKITEEPLALPPVEHASAHILNAPLFKCKFAQVYLVLRFSRIL